MYKILQLFFIFIFSISFVSAYTITYSSIDGKNFGGSGYYCDPINNNDCMSLGSKIYPDYSNLISFTYNFQDTFSRWKNNIIYIGDFRTISSHDDAWGSGSKTVQPESWNIKYMTPTTLQNIRDPFRINVNGALAVSIPASQWNNKDLQGNICQINSITPTSTNTYQITSSLNPITKITSAQTYAVPEELLNDYYYMKTFVFAEVYKDGTIINSYLPDNTYDYYTYNSNQYNTAQGSTINQIFLLGSSYSNAFNKFSTNFKVPYVLLKPNTNQFTFTGLQNFIDNKNSACLDGDANSCGNYEVKVYTVPIDGKCDFNQNGYLSQNSEFQVNSASQTITVPTASSLSTYDLAITSSQNNINLKNELISKGVSTTKTSYRIYIAPNVIIGSTSTDVPALNIDGFANKAKIKIFNYGSIVGKGGDGGNGGGGSRTFVSLGSNGQNGGDAIISEVNSLEIENYGLIGSGGGGGAGGSGAVCFECYHDPGTGGGGGAGYQGGLGGSLSNEATCYRGQSGTLNYGGQSGKFDCRGGEAAFAGVGGSGGNLGEYGSNTNFGLTLGGRPGIAVFNWGNLKITDTENSGVFGTVKNYDNTLIQDINGNFRYDDNQINNLIYGDLNSENLVFKDSTGNQFNLTVSEVTEEEKKIYIYKDGILDRTEKVDPVKVALVGHKIKHIKNKDEAEKFINDTVRLMTKFDIVKNLTYDNLNDKTNVKLSLQDIPQAQRQNITIYQVISKDIAPHLSDITILSDGGGQRIIIDKDPIIGWYFNESDSSEEIEYEVEGESEGGDIIITQEPILYNEGELIINYRQTDCNSGEAQILEIDDLEDTVVYNPDTSDRLYKVCIAHITEDLSASNALSNSINLFNYTNVGNLSFLKNAPLPSFISVARNDIYWDVRISQNNPTGNYSCIGSINEENSSLFGDCGYTDKRIWVHLGVDLTPPTTTVDIPYIAHTMKVTLNSDDNIGGVGFKELSYCIDTEDTCNPNSGTTTTDQVVPLTISCDYDWGCVKYLRFSASDLDDNIEAIKSEPLKLLDKGSACQADCTAKPSPNRFLKECRNLNGCEYYASEGEVGDQRGEAVALLCDFLIDGSYVKYNVSHDIQCPAGPFRKTKFVNENINFLNSDCDEIITYEQPVIFEGESVIMNIISCMNYLN